MLAKVSPTIFSNQGWDGALDDQGARVMDWFCRWGFRVVGGARWLCDRQKVHGVVLQ